METNERRLRSQPDLDLFDTFQIWLTLLSVPAEVRLLSPLVEDHVANALLKFARENANSIWLAICAKLPRLFTRHIIVTNHGQGQRVAVILALQARWDFLALQSDL